MLPFDTDDPLTRVTSTESFALEIHQNADNLGAFLHRSHAMLFGETPHDATLASDAGANVVIICSGVPLTAAVFKTGMRNLLPFEASPEPSASNLDLRTGADAFGQSLGCMRDSHPASKI